MQHSILYGTQQIDFTIAYRPRKSLSIMVMPNKTVHLIAPMDSPLPQIEEKVLKRAAWILAQQRFFETFYPKLPPKRYVGGESHLFLGKEYRLKVIASEETQVALELPFLRVYAPHKDRVQSLVEKWYRQQAEEKLIAIAKPLLQNFIRKHKLTTTVEITVRSMPNRWGSCTQKGKIMLNPELVKAPKSCIEYVVIHELCHLIHHNHTPKFMALQNLEMPDWEKWKNKLERLLA